ncbi:bacteriorhodopsin [Cryobacterium sp. TMS1-13-1]|uniref:bacteriorhodopsin n=1 Tax=Cryobacterium sp. TMS1-13-1 TaxID=1259220 RepID=UPI00106A41F8|nr:bacteriorhodopsin [Cryobacterium sp. TMS1-13-1]TFD24278.1 hypothetical protein E3T31_02970 [Cryobacterium sp. TMS1-13-1]
MVVHNLGAVSHSKILTWGVYPIAYLLPAIGVSGGDAWVGNQLGYSIAEILAKALYGLIIFQIARMKSFADDLALALEELSVEDAGELSRSIKPADVVK